jgi:hypothetical protein
MKRTLAGVASAILLAALTLVAAGQTDDELRQLYVRGEVAQIKKLARNGDARALAWMGRIKLQEGERGKAKEWYRRSAESRISALAVRDVSRMHAGRAARRLTREAVDARTCAHTRSNAPVPRMCHWFEVTP